jgi:ribonuclease Z
MDDRGLKITAFRVQHSPVEPAVGYRFDYKGRTIVISGDTTKTASLIAIAEDVDILLHEALQPTLVNILGDEFASQKMDNMSHVMRDIITYHTTPEEAAQVASESGAKQLIFNHIVPPMPVRFGYPAFVGDAAKFYKGPITVGEDGMLFSLPANSSEVTKKRLM